MFINRSTNVQKLGNLKPLLRTKATECVCSLFNSKQFQNRQSSSNDGDRINDEKYDNQTATTTTTSSTNKSTEDQNEQVKHVKSSNKKNVNNKSQFISIELLGPKDVRLPLPGNVGFAPDKYLRPNEKKHNRMIEKEFKLISDHTLSKDCPTTTIEFNLNNYETIEDRQNRIFENVAYNQKDELSLESNQTKFKSLFFVKVFSSTQFLLNDIKRLFPQESMFEKDFVIISVYRNPFSKIQDVNIKTEFVNLANSITDSLNKMGIWTNYLVPDKKRSFDNMVTCFESDDRFVNYGVEIESFADCKFINHINNAKLFIGSVFTSAKVDSVELKRVLSLLTSL